MTKSILDIVTLILLCSLMGAHYLRPLLVKKRAALNAAIIGSIFLTLFILIATDYGKIYYSPPPLRYLLPPYIPVSSYLSTVWLRILAPYTFSLVLSCLVYLILTRIKFFTDRLFEHEAFFIATAIFLMRHPYWIAYLPSLLLLGVLAGCYGTIRHGKTYRFSLYHLWLPSAILAVLLFPILQTIPFFNTLGFPNLY